MTGILIAPFLPSELSRYSLENTVHYFGKRCQQLQNIRDLRTALYPEDSFGILAHNCTNAINHITEDPWPDLHCENLKSHRE